MCPAVNIGPTLNTWGGEGTVVIIRGRGGITVATRGILGTAVVAKC